MNFTTLRTGVAFALALGASLALGQPSVCTRDGMTRSVEVKYAEDASRVPCEVIYRKTEERSTSSIYRANVEPGYCEARAAEFVDVLRGWGWQCDEPAETDSGS